MKLPAAAIPTPLGTDSKARFSGTDQLNYDIAQMPAPDDFDSWACRAITAKISAEPRIMFPPEMTGYEDLDDYGSWHIRCRLWNGLGSMRRCRGLGSLSLRSLGVHRSLGLDLGGR